MHSFYALLSSVVLVVTTSFLLLGPVFLFYIRRVDPDDPSDTVQIPKLVCGLSSTLGLLVMVFSVFDSLHLFAGSPMAPFLADMVWQIGFFGAIGVLFFFLPFAYLMFESVGISPTRLRYLGCRSPRASVLLEAFVTAVLVSLTLIGSLLMAALLLHPPLLQPVCPVIVVSLTALSRDTSPASLLIPSSSSSSPPLSPSLSSSLSSAAAATTATISSSFLLSLRNNLFFLRNIPYYLTFSYSALVHYSAICFTLLCPAGLFRLTALVRSSLLPAAAQTLCAVLNSAVALYTLACVVIQLVSWKLLAPLDLSPDSSLLWTALVLLVRCFDTLALIQYWLSSLLALSHSPHLSSLLDNSIPGLISKTGLLVLVSTSLPGARATLGLLSRPLSHDTGRHRNSLGHSHLPELLTGLVYLLLLADATKKHTAFFGTPPVNLSEPTPS